MRITSGERNVVAVLVPVAIEGSERFWVYMFAIGVRLPLNVRPSLLVRLAILSSAEVVAQSWSASTKRTVLCPGGMLD